MDDTLEVGGSIRLKSPLTKGMILALKSRRLDLSAPKHKSTDPMKLQLWNKAGEIVLQILIYSKENMVSFNSRTQVSLLDGWGERETIFHIATSFQSTSRFTISVHDCGDKYQILFNLTTVHFFQKRFSINSSATKVTYRQGSGNDSPTTLSPSLQVSVYSSDALPTVEKKAIQLGVPLSIELLEYLTWNGDNELRMYYLSRGNILHEDAYSSGGKTKGWKQGDLHELGITLKAGSPVAAIRLESSEDDIHSKSGFIQTLSHSPQGRWVQGRKIAKAINGSDIAAVVSHSNGVMVAVYLYYQDENLHLRELVWSPDAGRWVKSRFDAGVQRRGTAIYVTSEDGEIYVEWVDETNRRVGAKRSTLLLEAGVAVKKAGKKPEQLDGRD
ncbi:hypothetical protein M413DRAFT_23445 [Hebeloma cylindrosporum]|uniref:Galectin domain-containing protein n=1 Tax=Hebeloma cylindrosporum TaxID=76867 RepID=A0A0C2Z1X9_HEBCY|nr:hypothetical protein M413DRAFT_23445 [Hebeloma cylindrosporum h7]